jgi:hypothetical protein
MSNPDYTERRLKRIRPGLEAAHDNSAANSEFSFSRRFHNAGGAPVGTVWLLRRHRLQFGFAGSAAARVNHEARGRCCLCFVGK